MQGHKSRVHGTLCDDDGFTLVEVVVALAILVVIMLALAMSTISGYRALRLTRSLQQATGLANEAIEGARDLPYDSVIMVSSDSTWTGDPDVTTSCGPNFAGVRALDPDGSDPLACEPIVQATTGSFNPHTTIRTIDNEQFTVRRYVTWVDDAAQGGTGQDYKRFTVVVEWQHNGTRRYRASTVISKATRHPPVPEFAVSPGSQSKGYTFAADGLSSYTWFPHTIANYGVADTYELAIEEFDEDSPGLSTPWSYTIYRDTGTIGVFDGEGGLEELNDTDFNGLIDTGPVAAAPSTDEPTEFPLIVVVTYGLPLDAPSQDFTLKVTSRLDPDVIVSATDSAVGNLVLYLHNRFAGSGSPSSDTTARVHMLMSGTPSTTSALYNYSTNLFASRPGRYVDVVATASATATPLTPPSNLANWTYQVPGPNPVTLSGQPVNLRIWWTTPSCLGGFQVNAFLNHKSSRTSTGAAEITTVASATKQVEATLSCDYEEPVQKLSIDIPVPAGTVIPVNRWLEVRIQVTAGDFGSTPVLFMYDTSNSTCSGFSQEHCYRARLRLPQT